MASYNKNFFNIHRNLFICIFLILSTLSVYWQVRNFSFIDFDDKIYVAQNPHIQAGLTLETITWAFTASYAGNWHPITWLSHILDIHLYGLEPGKHHLTNLLFHILNTLLLFFLLNKMTGRLWQSGLVAALFALHPLHVESVAQIAERKDVLSTFFWFLTLWGYVTYVKHPGMKNYVITILYFIMGLMTKPMLVTVPFVMLLLDYYPLNRIYDKEKSRFNSMVFYEKIPFFILVGASSLITFMVQKSGGAVSSLEIYPLNIRLANAIVSYVSYIGKMILPRHLQFYYPHPYHLPIWQVTGAACLLGLIFYITIRSFKSYPYLIMGWLWYMGTLVPVIGLVQVGSQAMADRYTYVPMIGIFIMMVWGIPDLLEICRWQLFKVLEMVQVRDLNQRIFLPFITASYFFIIMPVTWLQVQHWKDDITLFRHAVDVNPKNFVAHNSLGVALAAQGKTTEAIRHYVETLRIDPGYELAHNNLGNIFIKQGRTDEAIKHYTAALHLNPNQVLAHNNMGVALFQKEKIDEAIAHFEKALQINPDYTEARKNLEKVRIVQDENRRKETENNLP